VFIAILGLLAASPCEAQVKLGIKGGFNMTELELTEEVIDSKNRNGFFFGPTLKISLPFLLGFDVSALYDRREMEVGDDLVKVKQEMVTLPVNVRINLGSEHTLGVFAYAGPQFAFNIGDRHKAIDEAREWKFEQSTLSANFGAGVLVGGTLEVSANYNMSLGKTADITREVVKDAFNTEWEKHKARTNAWQLAVAIYF
jgi:hypothetical protein